AHSHWSVGIWSAPAAGKPWSAWGGLLYKVIIPMFSSPLLGFVVSWFFMGFLYFLASKFKPRTVNAVCGRLQLLSAGYMGFSHGSNDAQKTMSIIALALFSATNAGSLNHLP